MGSIFLSKLISTANIGNSLWLMLMGMVGIFVVMGVVMAAVYLLNKFAKDKNPDEDQK